MKFIAFPLALAIDSTCLLQLRTNLGKHDGKASMKKIARVEEQKGGKTKEEGEEVEEQIDSGKPVNWAAAKDLLNQYSKDRTPEEANEDDAVVTSTDIAALAGLDQDPELEGRSDAFEGDMIPEGPEQLMLFKSISKKGDWTAAGRPWADNRVVYCYALDIKPDARAANEIAVEQFRASVPCLEWELVETVSGNSADDPENQKCAESPAIFISSDQTGCWSYVGMIPQFKSQGLNLQSPGCDSVGTAIHELGHAIGMAHEQSRPDRDDFVKINWDNMDQGKKHNFEVHSGGYTAQSYDYSSIMHYSADAFSVNGLPTIEPVDGHVTLGQRVGLARSDQEQVADMYQCDSVSEWTDESTCEDKTKPDGSPWTDSNGYGCDIYWKYLGESCEQYVSAYSCCQCGGGFRQRVYKL